MRYLYYLLFLLCCMPCVAKAQKDSMSRLRESQASVYNGFINGWADKPFTLDSFTTIDERAFRKHDLAGKKIFCRSSFHYCSPCRAELPVFVKMSLSYPDLLFVYITYDDSSLIKKSFSEFSRHNVLIVQMDKEEIKRRKFAFAYPTNFFVNAQGVVRRVQVGGKVSEVENTKKEWEQYISEL